MSPVSKSVIIIGIIIIVAAASIWMWRTDVTSGGDGGNRGRDGESPSDVTQSPDESRKQVKRPAPESKQPDKPEPEAKPSTQPDPAEPKLTPETKPRRLDWLPAIVTKTRRDFEIKTRIFFKEIVEHSSKEYEVEGVRYAVPERKKAALTRKLAWYNGMKSALEIPAGKRIRLPRIYIVRKDDNLTKISRMIYGDDRHIDNIFNANRDVIDDRDDVSIGCILILP